MKPEVGGWQKMSCKKWHFCSLVVSGKLPRYKNVKASSSSKNIQTKNSFSLNIIAENYLVYFCPLIIHIACIYKLLMQREKQPFFQTKTIVYLFQV
jgi:hypothetical protein